MLLLRISTNAGRIDVQKCFDKTLHYYYSNLYVIPPNVEYWSVSYHALPFGVFEVWKQFNNVSKIGIFVMCNRFLLVLLKCFLPVENGGFLE